jgi:ABC-2 type transport system ATP-binding protein
VRGVDLHVQAGEIFGFLGPNGAGKTTTLRMLATLIQPSGGEASVAGADLRTEPDEVRRRIGYVPQGGSTDPAETGRGELVIQGRLYRLSGSAARARAAEVLATLDLEAAADRPISTYSGGMKRRLDIGLGIVHRPQVLFLDEPTTGLDPQARARMWDEIRNLRELGTTVFLTTHYLEEADALCDRVAIIDQGRILELDTSANLVRGLDAPTRITVAAGQLTPEEAGAINGVEEVTDDPAGVVLSTREPVAVLTALAQQERLAGIQVQTGTLEDVFLSLTGREYRA